MKIKYIASDNTEFDTKEACINYERSLNTLSNLVSKELVLDKVILPPSVILNKFINDNGYLVSLDYILGESFLLNNSKDLKTIADILKNDLGYVSLSDAIMQGNCTKYPEVLTILSVKEDKTSPRKYSKYAFINKQYDILDFNKSQMLRIIDQKYKENGQDIEDSEEEYTYDSEDDM